MAIMTDDIEEVRSGFAIVDRSLLLRAQDIVGQAGGFDTAAALGQVARVIEESGSISAA